ncbi:MAG: NAD(P)H-binding protein [Rhodospirillaceae bacterium]|nr:NAD(P)H-binding protein [Rhodospirillaceae bacterium]
MRIAILGAGGMTGERLIAEALKRGHTVIGLARTPANIKGDPAKVERRFGDAFDRQSVIDGLKGADAVITTVGKRDLLDKRYWLNTEAHRNVIDGMKAHSVKRLVAISSFGAALDFTRPGLRRKIYLYLRRNYYGDMQAMERMVLSARLEGVVVRAPMLYNTPARGSYHVEKNRNVPGGRSVSRDDLAVFVLDCIEKPDYVGHVVSLADQRDAA